MTDEELDEIEARANAATSGPWVWVEKGIGAEWGHGGFDLETASGTAHPCQYFCTPRHCEGTRHIAADVTIISSVGYDADSVVISNDQDADFIAHAREDIPKLVAELRALRKAATR